MTQLAVCLAMLLGTDCTVESSWSSRYDPTPMAATIELRQDWGQLQADLSMYDGFVAVADCTRIGQDTYLKPAHLTDFERFLVVDCAGAASTHSWMIDNDILVELDYDTAERWGALIESVQLVEVIP